MLQSFPHKNMQAAGLDSSEKSHDRSIKIFIILYHGLKKITHIDGEIRKHKYIRTYNRNKNKIND